MNVTITGYISYRCNSCGKAHTHESQSCKFEEDVSEAAQEDDYIRYLSKVDTQCPACSNRILIRFDVWEHPESVVNYCYYGEDGADHIQCEFNIEHYFDDQSVKEEDLAYEQLDENDTDPEDDPDGDDAHYASPPIDSYMDKYDDDD